MSPIFLSCEPGCWDHPAIAKQIGRKPQRISARHHAERMEKSSFLEPGRPLTKSILGHRTPASHLNSTTLLDKRVTELRSRSTELDRNVVFSIQNCDLRATRVNLTERR